MSYVANLPWCAVPVAPYLVRYRIQHTTCLSPCGILNDTSSLRCNPSTLVLLQAFLREQSDSVTISWSSVFNSLVCCSSATTASWNSTIGSGPILSDYNTVLLPTAFLRTGLAFGLLRVKSNPDLFRWTALLQRRYVGIPALGALLHLPLMDAKPPILIFKERCK